MPVGDLLTAGLDALDLRILAGRNGQNRPISSPAPQKPGLALAGQQERLRAGTVQVLGRGEISFLRTIPAETRRALLAQMERAGIACLILTHGAAPGAEIQEAADAGGLPILGTPQPTSTLMESLGRYLEDRLAPSTTLHGTLIDAYGVGVLILGESGVGKSESALELILRGHRLISDDTVTIRRIGTVLNGTGPELSRHHMELRGLGIINIKDLYGVAAVRDRKDIDLVVRLDAWQDDKEYDRLGLEPRTWVILGVELPYIEMPVGPGRNLSILLEVAARHHLLRRKGYHPAKELAGRIHEALGKTP